MRDNRGVKRTNESIQRCNGVVEMGSKLCKPKDRCCLVEDQGEDLR